MDEPTTQKSNNTMASRKVFDVSKPGKSVPSQNARPAILTHSALPHDPMVSKEDQNSMGDNISEEIEELYDEPDEIKKRSMKSVIVPVASEDELIDNPDSPDVPETSEMQSTDTVSVEKPAEDNPKPVKHTGLIVEPISEKPEEITKTTTKSDDEIDEINEFAGQAAAKKAKKTENEEELKRTQAAQELIDSKKYYVPIGTRHGHKILVWVTLVLLLVIAASAAGYWYLTQ